MALIMRCDVPDCGEEMPATIGSSGRVEGPTATNGWWYLRGPDSTICACCDAHLTIVLKPVLAMAE